MGYTSPYLSLSLSPTEPSGVKRLLTLGSEGVWGALGGRVRSSTGELW